MQKIAILGDGMTAGALRAYIENKPELTETPIEDADVIIPSPGIPQEALPETTTPIISEIEFAYRELMKSNPKPKIIAVTGTNGKSTVTSLLAHIFDTTPLGNVGLPLISYIHKKDPVLVVELSSYQLEHCTTFKPDVAIYLNLSEDHLTRHKTMEEYAKQKAKITQAQTAEDLIIGDFTNPLISKSTEASKAKKEALTTAHPAYKQINLPHLPGDLNAMNGLSAYIAATALGKTKEDIQEKCNEFYPLPHRLEHVPSQDDLIYINDSKATNPHATLNAVQGISGRIHLICCGQNKGINLTPFLDEIYPHIVSMTVFGELTDEIEAYHLSTKKMIPFIMAPTLEVALETTKSKAQPGDTLLFSPMAASFDQFKNFEERGDAFKEKVQNL